MVPQKHRGWWQQNMNAPRIASWRGYAFELACLLHERQVKNALGIAAISSDTCSWRSGVSDPGAQVDLVIDRADGIIDLCEMKWSAGQFAISKDYEARLRNKIAAFASETGARKALRTVLVTPFGVKRNAYWSSIQAEVTADDLFVIT